MTRDEQPGTNKKPLVVSGRGELRKVVQSIRAEGQSIGLVPTMGALHEGHLSLVRRSVRQCDFTAVTIFVNPTQFGPAEDLSRYPRTLEADMNALARERVDLVFVPSSDLIYPEGFSTYVAPPDVAKPLEGECRPGHFRGVATVVLKLFNLVPADIAFFGQKDYQQARVIEHMVRDLNVPIEISVCPIVREQDGLAMSSRNRYLDKAERGQSRALFLSLERAAEMAKQGRRNATTILTEMRTVLEKYGITQIDYVALVEPDTLKYVSEVGDDTIALVAAHVGKTRLIDNRRIG